jgi:lipopolysaccharide/colanic/teichoic acid biosynthesis glycosyltransferase
MEQRKQATASPRPQLTVLPDDLMELPPAPGGLLARSIKRLMDVTATSALLWAGAPLMLAIGVAVRLDTPGPAIFTQARIGKGGQVFTLYKFRSMEKDAEQRLPELWPFNELNGPVFKMRNDPRVTPLGRVLRRWSLDELPQLLNVLKGDMSLVGPRPPLPREVACYDKRQIRRLSVKPGLTCTWQVSGRSTVDFKRWIEMDLAYLDTWSLRQDLSLCVRTLKAVLSGSGAY